MAFYRSYHNEIDYRAKYEYNCYTQKSSSTIGISTTQPEPICENELIDFRNFNYPIVIGNRVKGLQNFLSNCSNFNCDIYVPVSVNNCTGMLADCPNFGANIYLSGKPANINLNNMMLNKNLSKQVNIFSNGGITASNLNGMLGVKVTWSNMSNGLYNVTYGIYSYNDYTG